MTDKLNKLIIKFSEKYLVKVEEVLDILKHTCFRSDVPISHEQMIALLIVADQYNLNPFIKEIYAFPDKKNVGIVPVIGVDGWSRMINSNPLLDGLDFNQDNEKCTSLIYRKDRSHPTSVTEYLSECRRPTGPWQSHPKRMLRHKALIQCARLAFGYGGIYDEDEAERILDINDPPARYNTRPTAKQFVEAQEAQIIIPSIERDTLIADLTKLAEEQGMEAYKNAWSSLTKEERQLVGQTEHESLKKKAEQFITDQFIPPVLDQPMEAYHA